MLRVLRDREHDIRSTDEATLRALGTSDPLAGLLLRYRDASKRASAYSVEFAAEHVHAVSGRVHADFLQIGATSGRMACSKPNLQNVPRDPSYRPCFRPPEGRVLVKADCSQIELRIAAELARDERLLAAYAAGDDVHELTAAAVLGRGDGAVTKEDRQAAKALNFGLLYG